MTPTAMSKNEDDPTLNQLAIPYSATETVLTHLCKTYKSELWIEVVYERASEEVLSGTETILMQL